MVIRHAYTGWPGCTHDARVLRNSSLFEDGEQGNAIGQRNFIIADSAYPLRNWLIIPFRNTGHLTPRQHRFNRRLSSARQIVERCYGHLKGRFRRLREITVRKPPQIIAIIISGCILHNLCVLSHDDVEDFIDEDHDVNANFYPNIYLDGGCGAARRNEIMNALLWIWEILNRKTKKQCVYVLIFITNQHKNSIHCLCINNITIVKKKV